MKRNHPTPLEREDPISLKRNHPSPRDAGTDAEIAACFPVMAELRPHLAAEEFVDTVRTLEEEGYRLAYLLDRDRDRDRPVAVAGYRFERRLHCGHILYVDDLVTASDARSRGHGGTLLAWLVERAREEGCDELHLDSGVQRKDAHRFYETHGLEISSLHFRIGVRDGAGTEGADSERTGGKGEARGRQIPTLPALPTLETERLILRPFSPEDAPRVRELAGERDVALMTANVPYPYEEGMAEAWIAEHAGWIERGEQVPFAADVPGEGLVAAVGLAVDADHERAELGYWVGKPYWGRGYASEAARRVLEYGFEELGLARIHAHHLPENPASGRVLQKIGMTKEGTLRSHALHRGERRVDMIAYGVLAEEFPG